VITRRTFLATAIAAAAVGCAGSPAAGRSPSARTRQGVVRGFVRNGASIFLGMPYGASTACARRFLPPVEPASWSGERDATRFGQRAPQGPANVSEAARPLIAYFTGGRAAELAPYGEAMGEDCLVLNVLTPAVDKAARPVLFYVHGGAFTSGSGNVMTLCERLVMEEDVVVVSVNHRLGPLGFVYLGGLSPEFAEGNPGMLDLVAALRWVRDNIAAFGGDPDKVTLFGESGGGAKITLLSAMPQAQGLFRGAIVQSGLLLTPPSPTTDGARSLLDKLQLRPGDVKQLQSVPLERLLAAAEPGVGQAPVADGRTLTAGLWKQAPPATADVPMIVGYCADEMTLFAMADFVGPLDWTAALAKVTQRLRQPEASVAQVLQAYRAAYPAAGPHEIYSRMLSDSGFGHDMTNLADRKAAQRPPVYFYRMEYIPRALPFLRSFHTVELPLVGRMVADPHAETLSRQLAGAWAAFARSGNPNHAGLPRWAPRPAGGAELMLFGETSRFTADPQASARASLVGLLGADAMTCLFHQTVAVGRC
jgi:para-nitrobenzyl esterase